MALKAAGKLDSERLYLVPLSLEHLSISYVHWMNDPRVIQYLESGGDYNLEKLEEYLKGVEEQNIYFWAIHLKHNQKHIGNIKIDPVNIKHGLGEYGIMMGDSNEWGNGYGWEASEIVIKHCFDKLRIRKITLGVVEDNTSAVRLYKKLGFSIEGFYKDHGVYDGKLRNLIRMALFNPNGER